MKIKNEKGITLVALIITIIILVILTASTIRAIFKDRIIDITIAGVENYTRVQYEEMDKMKVLSDDIVDIIGKKDGVSLYCLSDRSGSSVDVKVEVEKHTQGIASYTFQKSLTGDAKDFKDVEEVTNKDAMCTYKYKSLDVGKVNYLRVIVTYSNGRTRISNLVKV